MNKIPQINYKIKCHLRFPGDLSRSKEPLHTNGIDFLPQALSISLESPNHLTIWNHLVNTLNGWKIEWLVPTHDTQTPLDSTNALSNHQILDEYDYPEHLSNSEILGLKIAGLIKEEAGEGQIAEGHYLGIIQEAGVTGKLLTAEDLRHTYLKIKGNEETLRRSGFLGLVGTVAHIQSEEPVPEKVLTPLSEELRELNPNREYVVCTDSLKEKIGPLWNLTNIDEEGLSKVQGALRESLFTPISCIFGN